MRKTEEEREKERPNKDPNLTRVGPAGWLAGRTDGRRRSGAKVTAAILALTDCAVAARGTFAHSLDLTNSDLLFPPARMRRRRRPPIRRNWEKFSAAAMMSQSGVA